MAVLLGTGLLTGCGDQRSPIERVRAFCEGIHVGEPFEEAEARYSAFQLQSIAFATQPQERLKGVVSEPGLSWVSGILVESPGSVGNASRPVCAVYYSNRFLGGNGKIVLAEFKAAWRGRD
jgi:hypothetical protein